MPKSVENEFSKKPEFKVNKKKYEPSERDIIISSLPEMENHLLGYVVEVVKKRETIVLFQPEHTYVLWNSTLIGYCIVYIANNANILLDYVQETIDNFEKISSDKTKYNKVVEYKKIFSELSKKIAKTIPKAAFLFNNYIIAFIKHLDILAINEYKFEETRELTVNKQIFLLSEIMDFLNWIRFSLIEVLNTLEECFNKNTSKTSLFSKSYIQLPNSVLTTEYKKNHLNVLSYTYYFESVFELLDVILYQINLNGSVIVKCKNCNKFFIPKRNNEIYCSKTICKKEGARLAHNTKKKENNLKAPDYYSRLCNRLRNNNKNIELRQLQQEYNSTKKAYKSISEKKRDEKLVNFLISFEKEYEKKNPHKYGRKPQNIRK